MLRPHAINPLIECSIQRILGTQAGELHDLA
jgi:hypothetical protein